MSISFMKLAGGILKLYDAVTPFDKSNLKASFYVGVFYNNT